MKKTKRILSMILAACMVLSVIVPAAFAEDGDGVLTYEFKVSTKLEEQTGTNANPNGGVAFKTQTNACSFLNISWTKHGFTATTSAFTARFTSDAYKAGAWYAIQITNVSKGTYDMTFDVAPGGSGGKSKVYVVDSAAYQQVITSDAGDGQSYQAILQGGTDLTAEQNAQVIKDLSDLNAILNAGSEGELDCYKRDGLNEMQSIGCVTFPETTNKSFVLLIQSAGYVDSSNKKYQSALNGLTMTPVTTEETFEEKIENATSGTITLTQNETVGDIVIKDGVTLDLNGMELTAASVTTLGTGNVIDSSARADGILKVAANKLSLQSTNSQFALYDSVNGGYKFYTATITNNVKTETVDSATSKYWFRITFSADSAYDLIARGDSGLKIEAALNWTDGSKTATPEARFYEGWTPAVKANPNIAISLTVKGVDQVQDLTVTASVTNTATASVTNTATAAAQ